jgi:predicted nucleotidyltransferase
MEIEQTLRDIRLPVGIQPPGFNPVTREMLQEIVQRIVDGLHPDQIILFGSYARYGSDPDSDPTPDSDLDLMVVMETDAHPVERTLAVSRLLRPRPFPMDILVRTPKEIKFALEHHDSFIREVFSHGRVMYDRER